MMSSRVRQMALVAVFVRRRLLRRARGHTVRHASRSIFPARKSLRTSVGPIEG
jgi:hypothetical protein